MLKKIIQTINGLKKVFNFSPAPRRWVGDKKVEEIFKVELHVAKSIRFLCMSVFRRPQEAFGFQIWYLNYLLKYGWIKALDRHK